VKKDLDFEESIEDYILPSEIIVKTNEIDSLNYSIISKWEK